MWSFDLYKFLSGFNNQIGYVNQMGLKKFQKPSKMVKS